MLVYQRETQDPDYGYPYNEELIYCLIENEFMIEASYLFRWQASQKFSLYGGAGANFGATYGNELIILGPENVIPGNRSYEAVDSNYVRVLFQGGMEVTMLKRLGMYLEFQGGNGWQIVHGGENNAMENCATFFGVNYSLAK